MMEAFGAVMVIVGVFTLAGAMFTSAPVLTAGVTLFTGLSAAFLALGIGALIITTAQIRDAVRELVTLGRDDQQFRQATWQRQSAPQHAPAPPAPLPPLPGMTPPSGPGQVATPIPTRLELQDRHGTHVGAEAFQLMQAAARSGHPISEESAVQQARSSAERDRS